MLQGCTEAVDGAVETASDHLDRAAREMARAVAALKRLSASASGDHLDQVKMIGEMANVQVEMAAGLAMLVRQLPAGQVDLLLGGLAVPAFAADRPH